MGLWEDAQRQFAQNGLQPTFETEAERYVRVYQEQTRLIGEFIAAVMHLNIAPRNHKFVTWDYQKYRYVPRWFYSVTGWMISNDVVLSPDGKLYKLADPKRCAADLRLEQTFNINIDEYENLQTALKNTLAHFMQHRRG